MNVINSTDARRLKIFISYATEDRGIAREIVERLIAEGFNPWYDQDLLPGQHWESEIELNQKSADVVAILLSKKSVDKRGFVQREAAAAVRKLDDQLQGDIYILPIRLDDCEPPERIAGKIQYIDWNRDDAWIRITTSLRTAARSRGLTVGNERIAGPFRVTTHEIHEGGESIHAYDHTLEYPEFHSASHPDAAKDLSQFFAATAKQDVFKSRSIRWLTQFQDETRHEGSSFLSSSVHSIFATSKLVSVLEEIHTYAIGTAHGNLHFTSHNFFLDKGKAIPFSLREILDHDYEAISKISTIAIEKLKAEYWNKTGEEPDSSTVDDWFASGAGPKWENFQSFTVNGDGLTFHFAPYEVHAYAYGAWSISMSFFELRAIDSIKLLRDISKEESSAQ